MNELEIIQAVIDYCNKKKASLGDDSVKVEFPDFGYAELIDLEDMMFSLSEFFK